jgi:hypothetical protein
VEHQGFRRASVVFRLMVSTAILVGLLTSITATKPATALKTSEKGQLKLPSGAGMLLRVE